MHTEGRKSSWFFQKYFWQNAKKCFRKTWVFSCNADKIIISLEKFFGSIGTGIKYTYSSLYASIEAAYGIKAAAAFSIGNYAIILVGATYLIYKMVDKDHYIKVGDIEYSSKDKNKKYDNK